VVAEGALGAEEDVQREAAWVGGGRHSEAAVRAAVLLDPATVVLPTLLRGARGRDGEAERTHAAVPRRRRAQRCSSTPQRKLWKLFTALAVARQPSSNAPRGCSSLEEPREPTTCVTPQVFSRVY
jgi:hypothetical protein